MSETNVVDKSLRSVFVGNIPYEATEEKLKDIFSEVGPVVSFKLVYDRETGKPKGYGFCEYRDQETALSAMRNLNGYEISGRVLRVDNACTEKSRMEMQSLLATAAVENPYGDAVEPGQAPEVISKAVASLPPEQMFELMKQMKASVQNNPSETRQMLLHNPQLAYALLQGLVAMRLVDPQAALALLQKPNVPHPIIPADTLPAAIPGHLRPDVGRVPVGPSAAMPPLQREDGWNAPPAAMPRAGLLGDRPQMPPVQPHVQTQGPLPPDMDMRHISDPRMARGDLDLRGGPVRDPREHRGPVMDIPRDPRSFAREMGGPRDPRDRGGPGTVPVNRPMGAGSIPPVSGAPASGPMGVGSAPRAPPVQANPDQEKAALIMQVLQLSDEQIALLPPEQRQSIMVLKEQIARSAR